jgi:Ca2+-binding RTX toxin-like protein
MGCRRNVGAKELFRGRAFGLEAQGTMKKAILIALMLLAVLPAPAAHGGQAVNLLISGGKENNGFSISLSADGRDYVILSTVPLEVGGNLCEHPEEIPTELVCTAPEIAGFEVNSGGGSDSVVFTSDIPIPVTIRGGAGNDKLFGGGASDKVVGGPGNDLLLGRRGDDWILGGPGRDRLGGGPGNDQLRGGPGKDRLNGGPGQNQLIP